MDFIRYTIKVFQNKVELWKDVFKTIEDTVQNENRLIVLMGEKPTYITEFKLEVFIDVSNPNAYNAEKKFVFYTTAEYEYSQLRRLFINETSKFVFDEMTKLAEMQKMLAGINASIVRNDFEVK